MLMPNEGDSQGELNYIRMRAAALYAENEAAGATIATLEKLLRESNNRYNELKAIVEASQDKSFDESMTTPQQYILGSLESRIEDLERELASSVGHIGSLVMAKSSLELKAAEALDRKSALMQKLRLLQSNGQVEQNNFNTPISMITERPNRNSNFTDDVILISRMTWRGSIMVGMVCWWPKGSYCGECQSVRKRVLWVQSEMWSSNMDLRDGQSEKPTLRVRVPCCVMGSLCQCDG
jgi:hypothetical protein